MQRLIQIDIEDEDGLFVGTALGYECAIEDEFWSNWALDRGSEGLVEKIKGEVGQIGGIAILKNMEVESEFRGQGKGNELIQSFLDDVCPGYPVLLECDLGETQQDGFSLKNFYEDYGFEVLWQTSNNPIMIMKCDE